jgi:hypothetical protein
VAGRDERIQNRGETGRAEFVFDDREEKLGWEWELFQADTPVPVLQFVWAQRELRAQMARAFGQRDELTTVTTGRAAHQALRSK